MLNSKSVFYLEKDYDTLRYFIKLAKEHNGL